MNKPLLIVALVFAVILVAGCTLKSDAQYSADQSRRANERAAESMKLSTQQTARGTALTFLPFVLADRGADPNATSISFGVLFAAGAAGKPRSVRAPRGRLEYRRLNIARIPPPVRPGPAPSFPSLSLLQCPEAIAPADPGTGQERSFHNLQRGEFGRRPNDPSIQGRRARPCETGSYRYCHPQRGCMFCARNEKIINAGNFLPTGTLAGIRSGILYRSLCKFESRVDRTAPSSRR